MLIPCTRACSGARMHIVTESSSSGAYHCSSRMHKPLFWSSWSMRNADESLASFLSVFGSPTSWITAALGMCNVMHDVNWLKYGVSTPLSLIGFLFKERKVRIVQDLTKKVRHSYYINGVLFTWTFLPSIWNRALATGASYKDQTKQFEDHLSASQRE